jgi:hypothetical protein
MKPIKTSLDMEDEIDLHKKGWVVQRVGWIILVLILIAASLGLFGNGLLSKSSAGERNAIIYYERFARFESQTELNLQVQNVADGVEVRIPQSYIHSMEVEKVIPEPTRQRLEPDYLVLFFDAKGSASLSVVFNPERTGTVAAVIEVNGERIPISHFIYP